MNTEVCGLLKAWDSAFRAGDTTALKAARIDLVAGIKRARSNYALKVQAQFSSNNSQSMWRSIKCTTDYKKEPAKCPSDPSLPDALNAYYTRFESLNTTSPIRFPISPDEPICSVTAAEVRTTLQRVNPRKAAGPDGIPGRVLKDCAYQTD